MGYHLSIRKGIDLFLVSAFLFLLGSAASAACPGNADGGRHRAGSRIV